MATASGLDINNNCKLRTAVQSQRAVTAYFSTEQLLPFDFSEVRRATRWSNPSKHKTFA